MLFKEFGICVKFFWSFFIVMLICYILYFVIIYYKSFKVEIFDGMIVGFIVLWYGGVRGAVY